MNTIEARKSTSLRLKKGLYEYVRERAKKDGRSVNNFLERVISEAVEYRKPNEESKRAIEEARRERPVLKGYTDMDELFADLFKMSGYTIFPSTKFKKDYKSEGGSAAIPRTMRPHKLIGQYKGCWECHIFPDLLLIWEQTEEPNDITLNRLGSHSELF